MLSIRNSRGKKCHEKFKGWNKHQFVHHQKRYLEDKEWHPMKRCLKD